MQVAFIALPGLVSLFLIARAFIDANRSDIRYAAVIALLLIAGLLFRLPERPKSRRRAIYLIALGILSLALLPFTIVVLIFGHVDLAGFVFHLMAGMGGTPWHDMAPFIATAFAFHVAIILSVGRLFPILDKLRIVLPALMLFLFLQNPLVTGLATGRLYNQLSPKPSVAGELVELSGQVPAAKPNLIVLYLEGFEHGYLDPERFGDIAAPVRNLEQEGISFTNIEQITATGWSLAGTVATQCGVPLPPPGAIGIYDGLAEIVPGVPCLSEMLEEQGYDLSYVTGATITGENLGYYGYGAFFSRSRSLRLFDEPNIRKVMPELPTELEAGWGLSDADVLSFADRLVGEKAAKDAPFAVFIATMDTHGPKAVVSHKCTSDGKGSVGTEMAPAVACTARLAEEFVRSIRAAHGDGIKIAVMSDHLNHMSDLTEKLELKPRRNTVIFVDPARAGERIDRAGAMIDVFPTLLDWLGFMPPGQTRAGLGTSLFSSDQTLVERLGSDELNARLEVDMELVRTLWEN